MSVVRFACEMSRLCDLIYTTRTHHSICHAFFPTHPTKHTCYWLQKPRSACGGGTLFNQKHTRRRRCWIRPTLHASYLSSRVQYVTFAIRLERVEKRKVVMNYDLIFMLFQPSHHPPPPPPRHALEMNGGRCNLIMYVH